jgi:hypothetical protein
MKKRIKRPLVKPSERREWLRRLEEEGQSISELAKTVDYDVRTVKKQIEMAHQERESHEARFFVLRQALEKHYADLLSLAENLDSGIIHSSLPMGIKTDRMWTALHEHLPRSPLWKLIDKMEHLNDEVQNIEKRAEQRLSDKVRAENSFNLVSQPEGPESGLYDKALLGAMNYHLHENPPCRLLDITTSSVSELLTAVNYERWLCAVVPKGQVEKAKGFITNLMAEVCQWPECEELRKTLSERTKVTAAISEELAIIILKRVIPGHCKYCPV